MTTVLSPKETEKLLEEAWLGLSFDDETLFNPLGEIPKELEEMPHLYYTWLLSRPEYFSFICSTFLNINLLPFQCVILENMWNHKFPMLIASRGLGKTFLLAVYTILRLLLLPDRKVVIAGSGFRQSKLVYEYCCTIWNNAPLLRDCISACEGKKGPHGGHDAMYFYVGGSKATFIPIGTGAGIRGLRGDVLADEFACVSSNTLIETQNGLERISDCISDKDLLLYNINGDLEKPIKRIKTPKTDTYQIIVKNGYSFKCSKIHRVYTTNGWKLAKDLTSNDYLIFENNYKFPETEIQGVDEDIAELMGLLISEGSINNRNYISITGTSSDLMRYLKKKYKQYNPKVYTKKAMVDYRGWNCKECYNFQIHDTKFRQQLLDIGLDYSIVYDKKIPWSILQSPRHIVIKFLNGLFNGDGSCFVFAKNTKKTRLGVAYYSVSEQLIDELQVLLFKLGYLSNKQSRKSEISNKKQWMLRLNGKYAYDLARELDIPRFNNVLDNNDYEVFTRSNGINLRHGYYFASAYYCGRSINLGKFDNIKDAKKEVKKFNNNNKQCFKVKSVKLLKEKEHLYDFVLPETHSFIGNGFIQHNSHSREIFENVISGFGAVNASPQERVKERAKQLMSRNLGLDTIPERKTFEENQIIISGTAYYHFNHFAEYWEKWRNIVLSKGDTKKLEELFPEGIPEEFDWRDYSVIRIPYQLAPKGFMDEANIARSKVTLNASLFSLEFDAVFSKDSDGFFKASLIESCVADHRNQIEKSDGVVTYLPKLSGDANKIYYMGVDTASQVDNFAIVILEVHPDHRRIVYSWTTNTKEFKTGRKQGIIEETDFFQYCSRKIRDLMTKFSIHKIAIDSQGGGRTIYESLHDKNNLRSGEQMLWETIENDKRKETDAEEGLHIIEMVNFRKQDYTSPANHNMRKDFEDKNLLFPEYNPAILASFANLENQYYQEMEGCIEDIEEIKRELTQIVVTSTSTGNERFDTPEIKLSGSEKGRARKDRYSALIMANTSARTDYHSENNYSRKSIDSVANESLNRTDVDFVGPAWLSNKLNGIYD